jgi:predicted lipid-binding transport protein (Tim44 family)
MDILFFAAISLYVFWKLREQFGRVDEEEKKQVQEKISRKKELIAAVQSQVMAIQKKVVEQSETQKAANEKIILSFVDQASHEQFRKILILCNISAESFFSGAKSTFENVIKSFATADLVMLRMMLSDKVFEGFESAINSRKTLEQNLITNVIAVSDAKIISAQLLDNVATVTISFVSKQINYVTDKEGKIIEGRKDEIRELNDVWTFRKDIGVINKNWVVLAT